MEHRETPRIGGGDRLVDGSIEPPAREFRLRPLIAARHSRQLDLTRLGIFVSAALAVVILLGFLGSWAMRTTFDWLALQPSYQIPFNQIHLVNEPPRWFHGGTQALLEGVRKSAREPATVSVLQISPDQLAMAFKKYAWVEGARVLYSPGQIHVELRYHSPVAWVQLSAGDQIVIDETGNILPVEDIDVSRLDTKIKVTGQGLSAPADRQPGVLWKVRDASGLDQIDERVVAAARAASFFLREPQSGDAHRSNALRMREINVTNFSGGGLFVFNAEGIAIYWGKAPGDESAGEPSAAEKWAMLLRWHETEKARFLSAGDYWWFSSDGLRHFCPHRGARHQPTAKPAEKPTDPPVRLAKPPESG